MARERVSMRKVQDYVELSMILIMRCPWLCRVRADWQKGLFVWALFVE